MTKLTERRKGDREKMATMVQQLCAEMGATVERQERDREIYLRIDIGDATIGIEFDGGPFNSQPDVFCMPWNVAHTSDARFAHPFGRAVGGSVNESHRRKCMAFAEGIDALLQRLRAAMECVNAGAAFLREGEPLPFSGASHDPEKLRRSGFLPLGKPAVCISAACYQRVAYEEKIPRAELTSFRHPDGYWQMYRRPESVA